MRFESKIIIPCADASILFDLVIRSTPEKLAERAIALIEDEFRSSTAKLGKEAKEKIITIIEDEVNSTAQIDELTIDSAEDVDISDIEIHKFSIVSLNTSDNTAKLECEVTFSFEVSFSVEDYSEAAHDNEDDTWYFVESKTCTINDRYTIPMTISAYFDFDEDFAELEVEDVNNGGKLDVFESFKPWKQHR